mmetsp:Transcript_40108/g.80854  ORF Transcript_40108/g.80854 Transcript_40108/m.80854 type:complete len:326 (+) Transcript_40108:39-1016(+)
MIRSHQDSALAVQRQPRRWAAACGFLALAVSAVTLLSQSERRGEVVQTGALKAILLEDRIRYNSGEIGGELHSDSDYTSRDSSQSAPSSHSDSKPLPALRQHGKSLRNALAAVVGYLVSRRDDRERRDDEERSDARDLRAIYQDIETIADKLERPRRGQERMRTLARPAARSPPPAAPPIAVPLSFPHPTVAPLPAPLPLQPQRVATPFITLPSGPLLPLRMPGGGEWGQRNVSAAGVAARARAAAAVAGEMVEAQHAIMAGAGTTYQTIRIHANGTSTVVGQASAGPGLGAGPSSDSEAPAGAAAGEAAVIVTKAEGAGTAPTT